MEGLTGDLGTMSVSDLTLLLGNRALTGTLVCEQGTAKKSLGIKDGQAVSAASNDPREYLGQFLINFGHITEDQLTKAFRTQTETKVFLGRILTMTGAVTEQTLEQVLTVKIRETTLALCRWREGSFRFARGPVPPDHDGIPVSAPLLEIHREADFRETIWEAMLQVFDSGQMTLELIESRAPRTPTPGSVDAQLFELIREGQTIDEIMLRLHATDFHLYQRLYALFRQGVIRPIAPQPSVEATLEPDPSPLGETADGARLLEAAKRSLADHRWSDAAALASRATELTPGAEPTAILKRAEAGLLEELRRDLLARPGIPRLAPELRVKDLCLSPREKYLLSRVNSARDLAAIVRAAPIREVDALGFFRGFLENGLVVLE